MKYKKIIAILFIISLFSLFGCNGEEVVVSEGAFLGGTLGVVADFEAFGVEESGVFTIFNTETFPIEVTLQNKGEYEIQSGDVSVTLLGPSPEELTGIASYELQNAQILDPISDLVPEGGEETITFASEASYQGDVTGFVDRKWFANIEFNYQTYAIVPEVCLKEDLTDERICEVNEAKQFSASGAPIIVTAVEESTAGRGIMAIKFTLSNVGGGGVAIPGEEFGISDELAFSLNDPAWECSSAGRVNEARLRDGSAEIVCKLIEPLAEGTLSTKQVQLTLDYTYRDLIQESLRIKESAS